MLHHFWYINHLYIQMKVSIAYKTVECIRITDTYIDITETIERFQRLKKIYTSTIRISWNSQLQNVRNA